MLRHLFVPFVTLALCLLGLATAHPDLSNDEVCHPLLQITAKIGTYCKGNNIVRRLIRDKEGYYLAFRLTGGIRKVAFNTYIDFGHNDDETQQIWSKVPCGCYSTHGDVSCDRHYRSMLLDLWPFINVEKVRVAVYKKGERKAYFYFNGTDTNCMNFFRQDRLLSCSYNDLSATVPKTSNPDGRVITPNYFSIAGDRLSAQAQRRFFINNNYGGCDKDAAWLVVGDGKGPGPCPWELKHKDHYPFILYGNNPVCSTDRLQKSVLQSSKPGEADVLTVSIKLRPHTCG